MDLLSFELDFQSDGFGIVTVSEPIGFDATDFTYKTEENRYARDIFFAGNEPSLTFTKFRHKAIFDKLQEYDKVYGFESVVLFTVKYKGVSKFTGQLDFFTRDNNLFEAITFRVQELSKSVLIKKRMSTKVDLLSTENLDGETIEPCPSKNILIFAKDILQTSEWDSGNNQQVFKAIITTPKYFFNVFPSLNTPKYDIKNTLIGSALNVEQHTTFESVRTDLENYKLIHFENNATKVSFNLEYDFSVKAYGQSGTNNPGVDFIRYELIIGYGFPTQVAEIIIQEKRIGLEETNKIIDFTGSYQFNIEVAQRGAGIYAYIRAGASNHEGGEAGSQFFFRSIKANASIISKGYNTIAKGFDLFEASKQVAKSVSGVNLYFPLAENGFYKNQFLISGNGLRNITKGLTVSFEDLAKFYKEFDGDYKVLENGDIYVGEFKDFFINEEVFVINNDKVQFENYGNNYATRYGINKIVFKYDKFQSEKETTSDNSYDIIHGNGHYLLPNKGVENEIEIEIPFIRDSFMLAEQQRKAVTVDESQATQNDDDIYIVDCLPKETKEFTESAFLQHTVLPTGLLVLTNDGSFNWQLLGLKYGDNFSILSGQNIGDFIVNSLSYRQIALSYFGVKFNIVGEITIFKYKPTNYDYIIRTDKDIVTTDILSPSSFANLRFSVKQNIERWHLNKLSTCNVYRKDKPIRKTFYQKNEKAVIEYDGLITRENQSFYTIDPILSPIEHSFTLIMNYDTWLQLLSDLREKQGYIRTFDGDGLPIKVYPTSISFYHDSQKLRECKVEVEGIEKYEKSTINIVKNGQDIIINNEYTIDYLNFDEKRNKIYIFDESYRLLYKPVFWQKVSINNQTASNINELKAWLRNLL